jgi:PKD repeat protein
VFADAGTFTVTLTTENLAGSASTSRSVVVLPARPVAGFTLAPSAPAAGAPIQFTDTSTGTIDAWSWDFGDGRTSSQREPSIAYASAGAYEVTLTVTNAGGSSTTQRTVAVNPPPPVAAFTAPATALTNEAVVFTDTSTAVDASYAWSFGDLGSSTVRSPSFAFPAPGTYTVTLVVTNAGGSDTATRTVQVTNPPAPQAAFTAGRAVVTVGQPVAFTNTSVAVDASYAWNFGGAGTSTAVSPSFAFPAPGTYTVTLVVTNAGGSDTATAQVKVVAPAQASFTASSTGTQVLLQDGSTGAEAIRISWGDGSPLEAAAPGASVTHDYVADTVATITVSARNEAGDWSAPFTVVVTIPPASTTTTGPLPPP